jgi:hypothetical protein
MRVFLRPPAGSGLPPVGTDDPARRSNGGDGGPAFEASPFRELLTEFRNLTERYGQALLALGEARGEVASLRSRVDLLEARMDMRLPLRAASTVAWELPDRYAAERAAEEAASPPESSSPPAEEAAPGPEPPVAEAEAPGVTVVVHAEEPIEPNRRRVSGGRAAVAGLAEALARAEDPTLADLPGAREAGEALAALQRDAEIAPEPAEEPAEPSVPAPQAEAVPPEEELVAEEPQAAFAPPIEAVEEAAPVEETPTPEPEAEPADEAGASAEEAGLPEVEGPLSPYTTDVVEPDWFADGDFAWLDAPQDDAHHVPEVTMDDAPAPQAEVEPSVAMEMEAETEGDGEELDHIRSEEETPAVEALQAAFEPDGAALEPEQAPEPEPPPPADAIQDAFDEPDASHLEAQMPDAAPPDHGPPLTQEPRSITGDEAVGFNLFRERPTAVAAPPAPVAPPAEGEEEAVLWFGDEFEASELEVAGAGWRDSERVSVSVSPAQVAVPPVADMPSEGAGRDDEESAKEPDGEQGDTVSGDDIERLASSEGWTSDEVDALRAYLVRGESAADDAPRRPAPEAAQGAPNGADETPAPAIHADQDWLRGRRGSAATAYRRLRRLFQS